MVVIGIDFGTNECVISAIKKGVVEVVVNDLSKRSTASVVSFGLHERFIGDSGFNQLTFNAENSVTDIKTLLCMKFSEIKTTYPFKIKCGEKDSILIQVKSGGEEKYFTPIQILGMLFQKLRVIAETDTNDHSVCSGVISVPGYYTEEQRRAVIQACEIANISVLRLITEASATAIVYGIYSEELKEKEPINVVFVDFGHASTSISVISFTKSKYQVISTAYEKNLGAGTFSNILFNYFVQEIKKKHKLDVTTNSKASFRLLAACERLKKF